MKIHLNQENLRRIHEKVETGGYPDAEAVIEAALEHLEDYEKLLHV
jgi:Arc/MetJ-type ribon-helix-helix transcriptional regulator